MSIPLVECKLQSWYYEEETSLTTFVDGNCEATGVGAWTLIGSPTLTKVGGAYSGTQCLRITGSQYTGVRQQILIIGVSYRIRGKIKGDGGSGYPVVSDTGAAWFIGTTSNTWQSFDVTKVAAGTNVAFYQYGPGTCYVEIDDISVENVIIADGNMEAAGVSAWTVYSGATLTKETNTPYSGTQCLRISQNGVQSGTYQSLLLTPTTKMFRIIGKARSDGTAIPAIGDGGVVDRHWVGTTSTSWQSIDINVVSANTSFFLIKRASGTWVEFDDIQIIPMLARTKNTGSINSLCQLGNGYTASSFPSSIGGGQRGMVFASASSQVLQVYQTFVSGTYTVCIHFMNLNPLANNGYIFDARDLGGVGYSLLTPGNIFGLSSGVGYLNGRLLTTGVDVVPYGSINTLVCTGMTLASTSKIVFGSSSGIAFPINSKFYTIEIYSGTLTPIQIRSWHERQMALINRY